MFRSVSGTSRRATSTVGASLPCVHRRALSSIFPGATRDPPTGGGGGGGGAASAGAGGSLSSRGSSARFSDPSTMGRSDWNYTPLPVRSKTFPQLGLGTWKSEPNLVRSAVAHAIRSGQYSHIDCAHVYGNHKEVGAGIVDSGVKRDNLWITTKLWNTEHAPSRVEAACRRSLAELGLTYLDLYLIHWPVSFKSVEGVNYPRDQTSGGAALSDEPFTLRDTWRAMERLVVRGLVRHIGVSNFTIPQLQSILKPPPATDAASRGSSGTSLSSSAASGLSSSLYVPLTNQIECHPYLPQRELRAFCAKHNIVITAYSPLGSASSHTASAGPLNDPTVKTIARGVGCTPAQVLIRWAIQSGMRVIPKSTSPARIDENAFAASGKFRLTAPQMARLDALSDTLPPGTQRRFVNPTTFTAKSGQLYFNEDGTTN